MSKVAIVIDSSANIPDELLAQYNIHIVPLSVIWGSEVLKDGIDTTAQEFYTRLKSSKTTPTTSQPGPGDFIPLYEKLLAEGHEILSLHISGKLSGTMASAEQARNHLSGQPIEVVDTLSASMGLGYIALQCARAAQAGANLRECKAMAVRAIPHTGALFAVSTLEFLHRGGRIGGAAAFLGTTLNLKPILKLTDGRVEAVERVRSMSKAVDRLLDLLVDIAGSNPIRLAGLHADAPREAEELMEKARQRFPNGQVKELVLTEVSPAIGAHTGPGTVGMAYKLEK
jgi:DegV family protein with EDD domain